MRQDLVGDLDQLQSFSCSWRIDGSDRRDSVPVVECSPARHAVLENVEHTAIAVGQVRHIVAGDDFRDDLELLGFRAVDLLNLR